MPARDVAADLDCHGGSGKKSTADGSDPGASEGGGWAGANTVIDDDYWLEIWAFGTSPDGLNLSAKALWALSPREYGALKRQWRLARDRERNLICALRADLYNTSARQFKHTFQPADFYPENNAPIERAIEHFVRMGYTPSEAAAMATSKQTKEHNLFVLDSALREAQARKAKGKNRRMSNG
jgi:hypothetical protein